MMKKCNFKTRRIFLIVSFFVFLLSLTSCRTAGDLAGNLKVDDIYVQAGDYSVTKGELWNELKWYADDKVASKFEEVIVSEYLEKVESIMSKTDLTDEEKELRAQYTERLTAYVIQDVYNFSFSNKTVEELNEDIEAIKHYDKIKLLNTYSDEIYSSYNVSSIDGKTVKALCEAGDYITLAKKFADKYYLSLAKELLAYDNLEEKIEEAFDERDTDDEDDIGYFTKSDYTSKFKDELTNQGDLNVILIRFASEAEFEDTLRSFGLIEYNSRLVYIPTKDDMSYSDYCDYYDDLSTTDIKSVHYKLSTLDVLEIYIQMYNYLYGGYRDFIYNNDYATYFESVDLRAITEQIRTKNASITTEEAEKAEIAKIAKVLADNKSNDELVVDTIYTRKDIDTISASFSNYLYETLTLPLEGRASEDKICYSTNSQTYNEGEWIAFKLSEGADEYEDVYTVDTTDDELYDIIANDEALKARIEKLLKTDDLTESLITEAINEAKEDIKVKIYDEAIEISYAVSNEGYSKTYGKAPNKNVAAVIEYNDKKYNINIVADAEDENALSGGLYDTLEVEYGITTAIDILSKKVVKDSKAYEDTAEDIETFEDNLKYLLIAFTNNYYASSGYPSSIGKYNFMMLYFHSANVDTIIDDFYRVNAASSSILTNYNSDTLLTFFKDYSDEIYNNYFSIGGKRLVVYVDANDDNKYDDVENWKENQKSLAQELILEVLSEVSNTTGSHATALSNLVKEINTSARAIYEDNPIAPENQWAKYRKAGLNVALEDVSAKNDVTNIDFKLKQRLYDIYHSKTYKVNETIPTEYLEELNSANDILVTDDGYNLLLVTSADFTTSAKFTKEDDKLGVFESVDVYYNEEYVNIKNIYNENDELTLDQIRLYVLENVTSSTSNLSASKISSSLTNFISPVLTRFTSNETQRDILVYFIENKAGEINFGDNNERFDEIVRINHDTADGYLDMYFDEDTTHTLETYNNWWTTVQNIVKEILLSEGDEE